MKLEPGAIIKERYSIVSTLGEGGMAVVYLALDNTSGKEIALKVLNKQQALDPKKKKLFTREFNLLSKFSHPNIVSVADYEDLGDGTVFYAMEYLVGQSLTEIAAIVIICSVILIHELGHFVAAKLVGIKIVAFSVGFGPRIWKKKIGETYFCISLFPIGGFVRALYRVPQKAANSTPLKQAPRIFNLIIPSDKEEDEYVATFHPSHPFD